MIGWVLSLDENRPPVPPADLMLRVVPSFDAGDVESARHAFDLEGNTCPTDRGRKTWSSCDAARIERPLRGPLSNDGSGQKHSPETASFLNQSGLLRGLVRSLEFFYAG
jgi:hypothetical protein